MADRETNLSIGAETQLATGLASGATTINVDDTSAFPAVPFFVTIDATNDSKREVVLVDDSKTATTMVLSAASSRGQDGTADVSHDADAVVRLEPVASHWDDVHDRVDAHEGDFDGDHGTDHDARDHSTAASTIATADLADHDTHDHSTALGTGSVADLGTKDHDLLAGLGDDDHTQYLLADGTRQATYVDLSGLTGATAASRYVGATTSGAPASGTFAKGDFVIDQSGSVWVCTAAGSPGTWAEVAGGSGSSVSPLWVPAGAFSALAGSPVLSGMASNSTPIWLLDSGTTESIGTNIATLDGWTTFHVDLYWANPGAGSGDCRLDVYLNTYSGGASLPGGTTVFNEQTITAPSGDNLKVSRIHTGATAGGAMNVRVLRLGANAADDLGNDIGVLGLLLTKAS